MNPFNQPGLLQALGWAVLNSFWQMALLWLIYSVSLNAFQIKKPAYRSSLAAVLLLTGFSWFVFTFLFAVNKPFSNYTFLIAAVEKAGINQALSYLFPLTAWAYLFFLSFQFYHFARSWFFANELRKKDLIKVDINWRLFTHKTAALLGIKKKVEVWLSEYITTPVTIGFWKPVILLPLSIVNNLTPQQTESILLHELAHIRRADYLLNLVLKAITTILYFNPAVRFFMHEIEQEREKDCDEMVLQFQYDAYAYASALLSVEKLKQQAVLALAATGEKKSQLLLRIECMLNVKPVPQYNYKKAIASLFIILLFSWAAISFKTSVSETNTDLSYTLPVASYAYAAGSPEIRPEAVATNASEKEIQQPAKKKTAIIESPAVIEELAASHPMAVYVNNLEPVLPALSPEAEQQVARAVEASKIIMQDLQWKKVEHSNDLDSMEKNTYRLLLDTVVNRLNWPKLADRLRIDYDQINWVKVNNNLGHEMVRIELDKIQQSASRMLNDIKTLKSLMIENNITCIPDSDITLNQLNEKQAAAQSLLNKIKSLRNKEVLHF